MFLSGRNVLNTKLNKIHYKNCQGGNNIDDCKKIVVVLAFFTEGPQFTCQYSDIGSKQYYKECKKLNTIKHFTQSSFNKRGKINYNKEYQEIKQIAYFKEKCRDQSALVKLVRLQISVSQCENYHNEYCTQYMAQYFLKVSHISRYKVKYHASSSDQISELAPRTAAFCVLSSDASSLTFPL